MGDGRRSPTKRVRSAAGAGGDAIPSGRRDRVRSAAAAAAALTLGLFATLLTLFAAAAPAAGFSFLRRGGRVVVFVAFVVSSFAARRTPRSRASNALGLGGGQAASTPRCYRYRWERAWRIGRGRIRARAIRVRARCLERDDGVIGETMVEGRSAVGGDRGEREAAVEVRLDLRHESASAAALSRDVRADHREAAGEERGARRSAPASNAPRDRSIPG